MTGLNRSDKESLGDPIVSGTATRFDHMRTDYVTAKPRSSGVNDTRTQTKGIIRLS